VGRARASLSWRVVAGGRIRTIWSVMSDRYAAHASFIAPARHATQLWRVLAMIVGFEIVFSLSPAMFGLVLPNADLRAEFYEGVTTFGTLAQFASFGIAAMGLVLLLQLLHERDFWSLLGPADAAREDLIRVTGFVAFWLLVLELLPPYINLADLAYTREFALWLGLLPVALAVLLIQVGTEEIFFRGYLQQQFACLSRSRLVWMVIPSIMFGGLHYWNGNGAAEGLVWAVWATFLGIACADLTARTGNLGAAIGLHLANNAFALLIVAVDGWPASGLALFVYPYEDPDLYAFGAEALLSPWVIFQLVTMLLSTWIMWLAARIAIRR